MEKKITKKEMYANLYAVVENSEVSNKTELLGFIDHEVELLEKKSSKVTMTATQKENLEIKKTIKTVLTEADKPLTVSEMLKDESLAVYTNQKISSLLRQLIEANEVVKTTDKKVSRFSVKD